MKNKILEIIIEFFHDIADEKVEVYNEFSLQHELGLLLRKSLPDYKIQFERNINSFGISNTIKKEIDIVIFRDNERYAIELKYPLNGQYPEQMYSFIKDIKFMEELKHNNFDSTFCVTLVKEKNFYQGNITEGIYAYFRKSKPINGTIERPTGNNKDKINIEGTYNIKWSDCGNEKYYIVEI